MSDEKSIEERAVQIERDNGPGTDWRPTGSGLNDAAGDATAIVAGMPVHSKDGAALGKIVSTDRYGITVDVGMLRREMRLRHEDVEAMRDGVVYLRTNKQALIDAPEGAVAHP